MMENASEGNFDEFWSLNEKFANTPLSELKFFPVKLCVYAAKKDVRKEAEKTPDLSTEH